MKRLAFLLSFAALSARATVYAPGFVQARITGGQSNTSTAIADVAAGNRAFASGTIMANTTGSAKDWDNKSWSWADNTVFAYGGEMWFEAGKTYTFGKMVDDWTYVKIGGTVLLDNNSWNSFGSCDYTPDASGWVPVEFRFGNGGGGAGKSDGVLWGLAYNTEGNKTYADFKAGSAPWTPVLDPGDATLLRYPLAESGGMTVSSVAVSGNDLSVSASFAGLAAQGTLFAFYGVADGGTASNAWDFCAAVATIPAGDTAVASYTVPGAGNAAFVAFLLAGTTGVSTPFFQWSDTFSLKDDSPSFRLANTEIGYTNLSFLATCTGVGSGATSLDASLVVARDSAFADVAVSVPLSLTGFGSENVVAVPLATNATYYVRVVGTNDQAKAGSSGTLCLTTLNPGFPTGALACADRAFTSLSFTGSVTGWGVGSSSADLTLEVSPDGNFPAATTLSFPGAATLSGAVPASQPLVATGLAGDTSYHARLRIVNTWGLETVVPLATDYPTLPSPVDLSDPGAVPSDDGVQTLSVSAVSVEPGTTYSVSLAVDGSTVKTWSGLSATGSFSFAWSGAPGSSHNAVFTVSSSFSGRDFSDSRPFSFAVGATVAVVSDLSELGSMVLRVGDRLVLPALGPGESLVYDTNDVVSVQGTVFLAEEPGANRIRRYAPDPSTGAQTLVEDGVLIVAPNAEDLKGALFVSRSATLGTINWCSASSWEKISGPDGKSWPDGPGDVALIYLPLTGYTVTVSLGNNAITVGHLGLGSTHSGNQVYLSNGSLTFRTADGSESWLRMAGRNEGAGNLTVGAAISLANDLLVDGMGAKDMGLVLNGALDVGDHVFRTDRVPFRSSGDRYASGGQIQFNGDVRGSGEIVLRADSTASLGGFPARKSFTGTWNPAACNHNGNYGGSGLFLGNAYLGHAAAGLKVSGAWFADKDRRRGASVRTGWSNSYQFGAPTNFWRGGVMPPKVTLDGGELNLITQGPIDAKYKDGVREDWFEVGEFRLATGPMGRLWSGISTWHNGCYPNSHLVVTNLVVEPGASAQLGLDTSADKGYGAISNDFHVVNAPAAAWDSGKGYEILPFFFRNTESNDRYVPVRDTATGRVRYVLPDSTPSSTGNIRELGANGRNDAMQDGSAWEAVTVYPWAYGYFAQPDSTVRILSGYLNVASTQFAPPNHANSASSTVDFGDRTAYVYVNYQNGTAAVGCRVKGSGGFVKSAGGTLTLHRPMDALTGGVWVDAGRLSLLDDATLGGNDVFVAAGAKLRIAGGDPFGKNARLDLENRDWISTGSKLELDSGATCHVRRLFLNGENRPRGYYGSSEAEPAMSALATVGFPVFVDDAMFSGPGILKVKGDDLLQPSIMIFR